ncbi:hypothetical protein RDI58_015251 [Solanum bulbocastanum]|uniref:RHOMBOID-like protein n=1 Tax=Solanum bulbocastanum TaxID=147425 RepID=A0AAN8TMZ6_SOLBU
MEVFSSWAVSSFFVCGSPATISVVETSSHPNCCPEKGFKVSKSFLWPFFFNVRELGALDWNKVVYHHQGWRLITCISPHWYHIPILRNWGSILTSLFIQRSVSVGASGALFGLIGAKFSEIIANWSVSVGALFTLLLIVVINLAAGMLPHVGYFAHIGGFMTGLLLGFVLLAPPHVGAESDQNLPVVDYVYSKYKAYRNVFGLLSVILLVTGFTIGLVMEFRGVNVYDHCHWCHYLSCVPTFLWKCDGT